MAKIERKFSVHHAARKGNLERLRSLIESGVSLDSRDYRGRTPLHIAAERNKYKVVDFLISSGCNLDLQDNAGLTPLMIAEGRQNWVVMNLLLDRGAKVTCADPNKLTLLHQASFYGRVDTVKRIVERGEADLNAATGSGFTPLVLAVSNQVEMCRCEELVTLLIRAGADVNRRDSQKMTALHWAAFQGETKVVQMFLEKEGVDLNPQDDRGETPLHRASRWGNTGVLEQLLVARADPKIKNNNNETALSVGIKGLIPSLKGIRLFIEHGAFFEDCDYAQICKIPFLKEGVLKDVDLCTKSIVNKFHSQSLPSLYSNPYFAKKLPSLEKLKLSIWQIDDVENSVKIDIQTNTYCNLVKVCPIALTIFCVKSLLSCQK